MINRYSWSNYNSKIVKIVKKNVKYNAKNKFNYIENSYYPHTRDIFCLAINDIKIKNIIDYGSNESLVSNLRNKINLKNKKFFIIDPFFIKKKKLKINNIDYKIYKNTNELNKIYFDLLNFGSSLQYIENYVDIINNIKFKTGSRILFTATPLNLKQFYRTKQSNQKNLTQNVHNFNKLKNFLKKKKFFISFKSVMNINMAKLTSVKNDTFFMNILFEKHE